MAVERASIVEAGRVLVVAVVVVVAVSLVVVVDLLRVWNLTGRRLGDALRLSEEESSGDRSVETGAGRRRERVRLTEAMAGW